MAREDIILSDEKGRTMRVSKGVLTPTGPRQLRPCFRYFRALNLTRIGALVKGFMSTYLILFSSIARTRVKHPSKSGENLPRNDKADIANVMFKWDTKLGACNKEPNTDRRLRVSKMRRSFAKVKERVSARRTHPPCWIEKSVPNERKNERESRFCPFLQWCQMVLHRTDDASVEPPMTRKEEDIRAELAALWAAVSKMASSLMWRTGQEIVVPMPQIKEVPSMKQETVEEMGEMPEIIVVSDAVEGISTRAQATLVVLPASRNTAVGFALRSIWHGRDITDGVALRTIPPRYDTTDAWPCGQSSLDMSMGRVRSFVELTC